MTDTMTRPTAPTPPPAPTWKRRLWWPARNTWRSLTSMRTALALLFLLALAAVPGALLPQRSLNEQKTAAYITDHGLPARIMDRLGLFEVFSSIWFTAIYVLLFISLVGCLTPRMIEHAKSLRARPVATPRNLSRLPRHERHEVSGTPQEISDRLMGNLRGWRKVTSTTTQTDGDTTHEIVEISAEKGYLREFGNLVFHFSLLTLLVAIAAGKIYGYEGTRILVADGDQGLCNTSTAVYDSFRGGNLVDGTKLAPFCVQVDSFQADYLDNGQASQYSAKVRYQTGSDLDTGDSKPATLKVNDPLRVVGDRVYLLGHGYAPTFTVTFPGGEKRTQTVPFTPNEAITLLSSGAARFDTPGGLYPNEDIRRKNQIAIEGLFAPTAAFSGANNTLLSSSFPDARDPAVAIRIYKGDTGLDTGRPQNVYSLDQNLINQGRLIQKDQVNLTPGQTATIDDGTKVSFDGYKPWVSLQVSHDPAQQYVLISAITMLLGLLVSLLIKRRRVWARLTVAPGSSPTVAPGSSPTVAPGSSPTVAPGSSPTVAPGSSPTVAPGSSPTTAAGTADGQRLTVVEMAGLARTDQAGWGEGFGDLVKRLLEIDTPARSGRRTTSEG